MVNDKIRTLMKMDVKEILKLGDVQLKLIWEDGHESVYPFPYLRRRCPCAMCADEWTGRPILDPAAIPDSLKAEKAELVGNYAIAFQFSDGHSTGIFTFGRLRELCPCGQCAPADKK